MGLTVSGTLSADGDSSEHLITSNVENDNGCLIHLEGNFGGGSIAIYFKSNDGTWRQVFGNTFSASTTKQCILPNGVLVKLTLSGSTSPSLFYQISSMSQEV